MEVILSLLPLLIPLFLLELGFRIYAILDIIKPERRVKGDNKIVWIIVIAAINFGWIFYLLLGRED
jgi:hypothetical protein